MNIKDKTISLKHNVKQHQAQIQILYKEIRTLEKFDNSNNSIDNDKNIIDDKSNVIDNFCIDNNKPSKKNQI